MAYFTPTVLPMIAVANIWLFFYTPSYGLLEQIGNLFGLPSQNWLGDKASQGVESLKNGALKTVAARKDRALVRAGPHELRRRVREPLLRRARERQNETDMSAVRAKGDDRSLGLEAIHELVGAVAQQVALDLAARLLRRHRCRCCELGPLLNSRFAARQPAR